MCCGISPLFFPTIFSKKRKKQTKRLSPGTVSAYRQTE
ncbi:hypothetical protein SD78_2518 [Bacillus badius]|nr:hypothetical protein SD78_2518 [Bacillus badius]